MSTSRVSFYIGLAVVIGMLVGVIGGYVFMPHAQQVTPLFGGGIMLVDEGSDYITIYADTDMTAHITWIYPNSQETRDYQLHAGKYTSFNIKSNEYTIEWRTQRVFFAENSPFQSVADPDSPHFHRKLK